MDNEVVNKPKKKMNLAVKIVLIVVGSLLGLVILTLLFAWLNHVSYNAPKIAKTATNNTGFIQAIGRGLYDKDGNEIVLEGTNIGGMFVSEGWLEPYSVVDPTKNDKNENIYPEMSEEMFRTGFASNKNVTDSQRKELMQIFYDNWFTAQDAKNIKDAGMNCVRLPFYYKDIMIENADGTFTRKSESDAFVNLDRVINLCANEGLYIILDLHGCPGSQNGYEHSGSIDFNKYDSETIKFWTNKTYVDAVVDLWDYVSEHYKDNAMIASYDLINEPRSTSMSTDKTCWDVFDKIYDVIRDNGDIHNICVEGCWSFATLPNPKKYDWTNVTYSYHWYNWFKSRGLTYDLFYTYQDLSNFGRNYDVPVLIGEFTFFGDSADWTKGLNLFKDRHYSWTMWTYKKTVNGWWEDSWSLYNLNGALKEDGSRGDGFVKVNVTTATYEEIKAAFLLSNTANAVSSSTLETIKNYLKGN